MYPQGFVALQGSTSLNMRVQLFCFRFTVVSSFYRLIPIAFFVHTDRVMVCYGYGSVLYICASSMRHVKSIWFSLTIKEHTVKKHFCSFMNRLVCWGPVRRGDWVDRILIDTYGSSCHAAVICFP